MGKNIAIVVVAQNIDNSVIERFKDCVSNSRTKYSYDIMVGSSKEDKFYKTRILNETLRNVINKYDVIIQTDIDLIVPSGLIDETYERIIKRDKWAFHHNLRYIDPIEIENKKYNEYDFNKWKNYKSRFCSGCWNGMNNNTWKRTKGYNEDMYAWGFEDTEFFKRSRRLGIQWIKCFSYPLVHVNHKPRQKNLVKENMKASEKYDIKTDWLRGDIIKTNERKK
jgi:hypothetical protein